eukprot:CAMPEP_0179272474 /NCGR_PEP_ID=MMETSP0797-20121207/32518_1 /TAXON_ID=47934 /ORGANISM="Dinophysis acuminata, Strain DAEP01" /LENGTH=206 /DNA_ID=CAMNT_0020980875 /DNA_START=24 /DNA_END=645 /DNA_ORIENTATION=-
MPCPYRARFRDEIDFLHESIAVVAMGHAPQKTTRHEGHARWPLMLIPVLLHVLVFYMCAHQRGEFNTVQDQHRPPWDHGAAVNVQLRRKECGRARVGVALLGPCGPEGASATLARIPALVADRLLLDLDVRLRHRGGGGGLVLRRRRCFRLLPVIGLAARNQSFVRVPLWLLDAGRLALAAAHLEALATTTAHNCGAAGGGGLLCG